MNIRRESGSRKVVPGRFQVPGPAADLLWRGLGMGDPGESLGGEVGTVSGADQRGPGRPWQRSSWAFILSVFSAEELHV